MPRTSTLLSLIVAVAVATPVGAADRVGFNRDVRAILSENCYECHGPDAAKREADLRLDLATSATADRDGHRVIAVGKPGESELIARVTTGDVDLRMPPAESKKRLTAVQIASLREWISQGAEYEPHWSFIPVTRPALPQVSAASGARNGIDRFILARLEREGLAPSEVADRRTLLRRVTLDLTGLPPTPDELTAFLADRRPGAYERVVDRLLASPRYGEQMALPWLNAARYADTSGYQADWERFMWPWRDWVVDAYNRGMPFDQFTVEQLAGDLLPNATFDQTLATGFNRNHRINDEGGVIAAEYAVEYVVDRVDTTSTVWLGLTMGLARCHDHKYDPFSQTEFYELFALFNNVPEKGKDGRKGYSPPTLDYVAPESRARLAALDAELADVERRIADRSPDAIAERDAWLDTLRQKPAKKKGVPGDIARALQAKSPTPQQLAALDAHFRAAHPRFAADRKVRNKLRKDLEALEESRTVKVMVMQEMETPRETFVLERGQYDQPDKSRRALPDVPDAFGRLPSDAPKNRLGFARWLVSGDNPLTARVAVNRYWQKYFGTGLVRTAEDFGSQGTPPTHPELLDWLAAEFTESGWDVKRMQRLIVTSATYRQSSKVRADLLERDPKNRLLARGPRFRLSGEAIRDQALSAAGLLVETIGGPSVKPYQPPGLWADVSFQSKKRSTDFYVQDHGAKLYRRSLYTFWKRSVAPPQMVTFDSPSREMCMVRTSRTSTPLQVLTLLNDVTFVEAARGIATRMLRDGGDAPDARIRHGLDLLALAERPDTIAVLRRGHEDYLAHYRAHPDEAARLITVGESPPDPKLSAVELAAWTSVASVLLNLDATVTKE